MKSNRTWILLSTVVSIGGLSLLSVQTAQAQEAFQIDVTQESATGLFMDGDRVRVINGGGHARVAMASN